MTAQSQTQRGKAGRFRELHSGDDIVVLPCAWDVASARVFEEAGFPALGTTSAGIAASLGYTDGQKITFGEQLETIRRIVRHLKIPVSADLEAGYGKNVDEVVANVREVLYAGAVGINIEDEDHARLGGGLLEPISHMGRKLEAIRAASEACSLPVFINAKTDAIWLSAGGDEDACFREAVKRAIAYGAAGADCIFVTGDLDRAAIARLVEEIPHPLNIVMKSVTPPLEDLRAFAAKGAGGRGIKRLSMGSGPMRAGMGLTREIAHEALTAGTYRHCTEHAISYGEVMNLLAGRRSEA